jgi:putative Mg2+ transporter-C (MgtC) family protein
MQAGSGLEATMDTDAANMTIHLLVAMAAGGLIGLERSYHGRPAGFRTHTIVCLASSLLMLITIYQHKWLPGGDSEAVSLDPTRLAQGVMTGIGFLGAGVIMKEGASVRGLTTAASIWITAAIGILAGIGMYAAVSMATALTIGALWIFRLGESRMPALVYAYQVIRFHRSNIPDEAQLRRRIESYGFTIANMSYRLTGDGTIFEYSMNLKADSTAKLELLSRANLAEESVLEFSITPIGNS